LGFGGIGRDMDEASEKLLKESAGRAKPVPIEISGEHRKRIEEIRRQMDCPKDFACCKSDFQSLCRTRIIVDGKLIECLEEKPQWCHFALPFGHTAFCKCPLRNYIANNFYI